MERICWSDSRPDRSELRPCTICGVVDGDCGPNGFRHTGRRWAIGITWPGTSFGSTEAVLDGVCRATIEIVNVPDTARHHLSYRGACVGCGWAASREFHDSNAALEDALDHALPRWKQLPIVERLGHDPSSKQRDRWLAQVDGLYVALGFEECYAPGSGGLIRTMRTGCGTRSHWSVGFYDVCAGVAADIVVEAAPEQMGLF